MREQQSRRGAFDGGGVGDQIVGEVSAGVHVGTKGDGSTSTWAAENADNAMATDIRPNFKAERVKPFCDLAGRAFFFERKLGVAMQVVAKGDEVGLGRLDCGAGSGVVLFARR